MKRKRKIIVLTASRAEYSRYRSVLKEIKKHPNLNLHMVAAGAHLLERTGKSVDDIRRDGLTICDMLYQNIEGENLVTMAKSTGHTIVELSSVIERARPDIALVMGDRFEAFAFATVSALMNLHIAHIQGGEVTGTIDESLRHAITKLSHFHFPSTKASGERIIRLGEDKKNVYVVGCPAVDSLLASKISNKARALSNLNPFFKIKDRPDPSKPYLLVVQHPVTTEYEKNKHNMTETMKALARLKYQAIMLWPNLDAGADEVSKAIRHFLIKNPMQTLFLFKHFPMNIFTQLMANTDCLIGNSSAGIREACYFGTPVVNIGTRQAGRERASNVLDVTPKSQQIVSAIKQQMQHGKYPPDQIYGDGSAGKKIAHILAEIKLSNPQKRICY